MGNCELLCQETNTYSSLLCFCTPVGDPNATPSVDLFKPEHLPQLDTNQFAGGSLVRSLFRILQKAAMKREWANRVPLKGSVM